MYAALWRALPGPVWVRLLVLLTLLAVVVALLFAVVFPWLAPRLPFNDVTVAGASVTEGAGRGMMAR